MPLIRREKLMKKELSLFLQFVLILLLSGGGLFGLSVLSGGIRLSFWGAYSELFKDWIAVFFVLAVIRLFLVYLSRLGIAANSTDRVNSVGNETWITVQYLFVAFLSIYQSFYVPLMFVESHIHLNHLEMWLNVKDTFLHWFIIFLGLSLIRLGIIYFKSTKHGKYSP